MNKSLNDSSSCPLCGNKSGKILQLFNCENSVDHFGINLSVEEKDFLKTHINNLWGSVESYFKMCDNCYLSFASPFVAGDSLLYEKIYQNSIGFPQWKWEFEKSINKILEITHLLDVSAINFLEIGAGNGAFVNQILNKVNVKSDNILSTEFSSYGKSEIEKLGVKCVMEELSSICLPENKEKFDFICLFQVLEHLQNLNVTFQSLSYLLKPNGYIFIAVPSNQHREYFETIGIVEDVPPIHITRWSKQTFQYVGNKYGWSLVDYEIEPNDIKKNIAKYISYKYKNNKIINRTNLINNLSIRLFIKSIIFTPLIFLNLKPLLLIIRQDIGISQWVQFKKKF